MKKQILVLLIIQTNLCLLNAQPSIQWQRSFGGSQSDGAYSICQAIDGGYVVAGYTGSNDSDGLTDRISTIALGTTERLLPLDGRLGI